MNSIVETLKRHWPEYLMEMAGLGIFMISACTFGALLEHPGSLVHQSLGSATGRRVLMGLLMGLTAVAIIYSPWGRQSGAHINPAVTLTFWRLGKVSSVDAACYGAAHFAGASAGVLIVALATGPLLAHPSVNYVATVPGPRGPGVAFAAEFVISFILMTVVLNVSHTDRLARYTGLCAGALAATWIVVEGPDLFHRASARHARGVGALSAAAGRPQHGLRQAAP
jgi:aquaporin Z